MRLNPLIGGMLLLSIVHGCSTAEDRDHEQQPYSIVYNSILPDQDTVNYEIFLMAADGSEPVNLTRHPAVDWVCHAWKQIVYFISDRDTIDGIYFLYALDLPQNSIKRISSEPLANSWLDSRNNGTELVICRQEGTYRSFSIIDTTGFEIREVLRTNQYQISDPNFSPDGKWIVFRSTRSGIDELWIADELGANQRQLTHYPADLDDPGESFYHAGPPQWVPGSNSISYISRQGAYNHIFQINADGSQMLQLTSGLSNQGWHSWTPDGKTLIYDGDDGHKSVDLFALRIENQQLDQLTFTSDHERGPIVIEFDRIHYSP